MNMLNAPNKIYSPHRPPGSGEAKENKCNCSQYEESLTLNPFPMVYKKKKGGKKC